MDWKKELQICGVGEKLSKAQDGCRQEVKWEIPNSRYILLLLLPLVPSGSYVRRAAVKRLTKRGAAITALIMNLRELYRETGDTRLSWHE
jgi:hypothetical protein